MIAPKPTWWDRFDAFEAGCAIVFLSCCVAFAVYLFVPKRCHDEFIRARDFSQSCDPGARIEAAEGGVFCRCEVKP